MDRKSRHKSNPLVRGLQAVNLAQASMFPSLPRQQPSVHREILQDQRGFRCEHESARQAHLVQGSAPQHSRIERWKQALPIGCHDSEDDQDGSRAGQGHQDTADHGGGQ